MSARQTTMFGEPPPPDTEELDQYFTPPEVAEAFASWSRVWEARSVLEPSAGEGALIDVLDPDRQLVTAVEVDAPYADYLVEIYENVHVIHGDFLEVTLPGGYDLAFGNPPYKNGLDIEFVLKALTLCDRVCFIMQSRILHGSGRFEKLWKNVRLNRIAHFVQRAFPGAIYDYSCFEIVAAPKRGWASGLPVQVSWIDLSAEPG